MPLEDVVRGNVRHATILGPTLTPTALTASTTTSQTFTVTGLRSTHTVFVNLQGAQTAGVGIANAYVSANDTLTIVFSNSTAGTPTPTSGVYRILVCSCTQNPLPTVYA